MGSIRYIVFVEEFIIIASHSYYLFSNCGHDHKLLFFAIQIRDAFMGYETRFSMDVFHSCISLTISGQVECGIRL